MQILEITFKVTHTVHLENMQQKDNYSAYGCYLLYLALLFHANRMKFLQTFYRGGWMYGSPVIIGYVYISGFLQGI